MGDDGLVGRAVEMDLVESYSYAISDRNYWIEIGRFKILEIKLDFKLCNKLWVVRSQFNDFDLLIV